MLEEKLGGGSRLSPRVFYVLYWYIVYEAPWQSHGTMHRPAPKIHGRHMENLWETQVKTTSQHIYAWGIYSRSVAAQDRPLATHGCPMRDPWACATNPSATHGPAL